MLQRSNAVGKRSYEYIVADSDSSDAGASSDKDQMELPSSTVDTLLKIAGRESLREKAPTLEELERALENGLSESDQEQAREQAPQRETRSDQQREAQLPLVAYLMGKGYLRDSPKWISPKGFVGIGNRILADVMKALKSGDMGLHQAQSIGTGSVLQDSTRPYELGDDVRLINVPKSLINAIQRNLERDRTLSLPLQIAVEDFEEFETTQDVRVAIVYCIDLSSTMRYSAMYGDMSRIEAAKRALWSLYLLNRRFFTSDSVYVVGFGALASKVKPEDIPYLKTFEPGSDFLHYTNYQAAFRLARRILQKDGAINKRIVLVTDGHPSACFIDSKDEQDKILAQRPYSHFYTPERQTIENFRQSQDLELDTASGELVYLCYRYRQVDQYIGEKTIAEARKCRALNIDIDTIMISEEESLLGYVNEMERYVKGRSYYINPGEIDKVLLTDYISSKKQKTLRSHSQW